MSDNPIADLLGMPDIDGIYALTDADGRSLAVIKYMAKWYPGSDMPECAYDATDAYGRPNPCFGLRAEYSVERQKARFAARFILRGDAHGKKHAQRVAAFERIAAVYRHNHGVDFQESFDRGHDEHGKWVTRLRDDAWSAVSYTGIQRGRLSHTIRRLLRMIEFIRW